MIETVVDLTYRGLPLGRRIKLTQVRPTSGVLELAAPMPVGTQLAIASDDGLVVDATVVWVHEQVTGGERPAAMVVSPVLAEPAAAWWSARVTLPDEDWAAQRTPRGRPVTVRPRSQTLPTPPPAAAATEEVPTIVADLDARVLAAAGLAPERQAVRQEPPSQVAPLAAREVAIRRTGEHEVVDDGRHTLLMPAVDLAEVEREVTAAAAGASDDDTAADDVGLAGAASDDDDPEITISEGPPLGDTLVDGPPAGGAGKRRRKRR